MFGSVDPHSRCMFRTLPAPRYITFSSLFWVSLAVVAALAIAHYWTSPTVWLDRKLATVAAAASLVTLVAVSYGVSWAYGMGNIKRMHGRYLRGGECLLFYERTPDKCLQNLHPNPRAVRAFASLSETLAVGLFAPSEREWPPSLYTLSDGPGTEKAGWIDQPASKGASTDRIKRQRRILLSGWARDPFVGRTAAWVLIVVDGKLMGRARTGLRRPDVAKVFGQEKLSTSGWRFRLDSSWLDPGSYIIEAYALMRDQRRIVKLNGSRVIEVSG